MRLLLTALRTLVILVAMGLVVPGPAAAEEVIRSFSSDIRLMANGTARIIESIVVKAEGVKILRGIYRDIPTVWTNADGAQTLSEITISAVERDGLASPYHTEETEYGLRVYVGDTDTHVAPGIHEYVIDYSMTAMKQRIDDSDALFVNAIGPGWDFPIERAEATITLPENAEIAKLEGYTGVADALGHDVDITRISDNSAHVVVTRPFQPFEGLSVLATFEQPAVVTPPPASMPAIAQAFQPTANTSTLAIVIGNRNYRNGAPEVAYAEKDSADVARFLTEVAGLPADAIIVRNDMTGQDMAALFGRAGLRGGEGQLHKLARYFSEVFVFYSGHGVPAIGANERPEGYLLPVDADPALPEFLGYPLAELEAQLQSLPVARATLILDACFSGLSEGGTLLPGTSASFGVGVGRPKSSAKVTVLSATDFAAPQLAHWMPDKKNGVFTWYALKGLYGEADGDGDGRITAGELSDYAGRQVSLFVYRKDGRDQTPSLHGSPDTVLVDFGAQAARPQFQ